MWVDGQTRGLQVIFRDAAVDQSHYFQFHFEWTLPEIIRYPDVEPLHRFEIPHKGLEIFLSRLHYFGLVVWINPKKYTCEHPGEARPVCVFSSNFHIPRLCTPSSNYQGFHAMKIEESNGLGMSQKLVWHMTSVYFTHALLDAQPSHPNPYPRMAMDVFNMIEERQRFDREGIVRQSRYLVLIGSHSDVALVDKMARRPDMKLTKDSVDRFLRNLGMP